MKSLKPSHREKKRYLLIKGKDANKKNIEEVILEFIGVLGWVAYLSGKISINQLIMFFVFALIIFFISIVKMLREMTMKEQLMESTLPI